MNAKPAYDVLVVGGGPAGAAAAIYAARKGIRTGLAAERLGGQLLDTVASRISSRSSRPRGTRWRGGSVIGGGNSGVEAAIELAGLVSHVTVIEYDAQLRAAAVLKRKLASLGNVSIVTSAETTEVLGNGRQVTGVIYRDRQSGGLRTLELAGVFVQIGLVPNTDWLEGTLRLSARVEIDVDARGQTSVPGVFAAADCTVVPYKQIVIAMGEGAKASLGAFDHLIRSPLPVAA